MKTKVLKANEARKLSKKGYYKLLKYCFDMIQSRSLEGRYSVHLYEVGLHSVKIADHLNSLGYKTTIENNSKYNDLNVLFVQWE